MNKFNFFLILMIISFLMFPFNFADSQSDYYFDSDFEGEGNGTIEAPYREFSNDKITDNATVHFSKGNYSFTSSQSFTDITFIGKTSSETILNGNGYNLKVENLTNFKNITLTNFQIVNEGSLNGENTTFSNLIPTTVKNDDTYGGAIYAGSNVNINLVNCQFFDNLAKYGGAIYVNGGNLNIQNSIFLNNTATGFGGAIVGQSSNIVINNTRFLNSTAKNNAGGGIYLISSTCFLNNATLSDLKAIFGAAITSLNSKLNITNTSFLNNHADYEGGAIYHMYGVNYIASSKFMNNSALNGGAIYLNAVNPFEISTSLFQDNTALNNASAIYMLLVNNTISDVDFTNNTLLNTSDFNLFFTNGNYTRYVLNQTNITDLPSYYDLRDYNHVTPPKDQKDGGNCWAFSAIASLESCILKASGDMVDLSEENMKNLMAIFSDYGFSIRWPNDGGENKMAIGYLASWLGPIFESEDPYIDKSALSPILNSSMHVQNILLLDRQNFTDNDDIKRAIMEYGAVSTTMYFDYSAFKNDFGKYYHYYNETHATNHAVAIVGWDDSFKTSAEGDGAWIVKNSWGPNWLYNGYFYVSYYDKAFAVPGSYSSFTFILNDTKKFDKIYQYDVSGYTDYLFLNTSQIWYKNQFKASDDEFLCGVSTYFDKNITWELSVNVNDKLQLTQKGTSFKGYSTVNLNRPIPLAKGDVFEIIFKITSLEDVNFPISEAMSLNKVQYTDNISFLSFNGEDWIDLYDFEWTYPGHWYESQVACIKAFTHFTTFESYIESINITYDSFDLFNITVLILDEDKNPVGNGNVTFNINGVITPQKFI